MFVNPQLKYSLFIIIIILLASLVSCNKDIVETDEELIPYFELFAQEGAARGIIVDYEAERIEGLMQDITSLNVLGQCFRNEDKPKKVVIDNTYWAEADELEKQFLIFHELGHCFLNRSHLDTRKVNSDTCTSIMHSTPQACTFRLTEENKKEYLDELFDI